MKRARRWKGEHPFTDWIVRQGCRTLIRKADPETMALFGYSEPIGVTELITSASLVVEPLTLTIGGSCEIGYKVQIREGQAAHIRIEYGIDFVKDGGHIIRKAVLLSDKTVPGGLCLTGTRTHRWADLTTRRHYPGEHRITLLVNGREVANVLIKLEVSQGASHLNPEK